jgi:hypothetical protein
MSVFSYEMTRGTGQTLEHSNVVAKQKSEVPQLQILVAGRGGQQ